MKLCGANPPAAHSTFRMLISSPNAFAQNSTAYTAVATRYGAIKPSIEHDMDADTDQLPFGQAGIPSQVVEEWGNNPHFDDTGGDTLATVNLSYLLQIAQIQVTYQATLMGIGG